MFLTQLIVLESVWLLLYTCYNGSAEGALSLWIGNVQSTLITVIGIVTDAPAIVALGFTLKAGLVPILWFNLTVAQTASWSWIAFDLCYKTIAAMMAGGTWVLLILLHLLSFVWLYPSLYSIKEWFVATSSNSVALILFVQDAQTLLWVHLLIGVSTTVSLDS